MWRFGRFRIRRSFGGIDTALINRCPGCDEKKLLVDSPALPPTFKFLCLSCTSAKVREITKNHYYVELFYNYANEGFKDVEKVKRAFLFALVDEGEVAEYYRRKIYGQLVMHSYLGQTNLTKINELVGVNYNGEK